jgi:hypothetical protein
MTNELKNELANAQLDAADIAALAGAARDLNTGDFVGIPLRFSKGPWFKIPAKNQRVRVGDTDPFAVDMRSDACGWIQWVNKKPVQKYIFRPIDGFVLPTRDRLPDQDKSRWPLDKDGKRSDPWQENHQFVFKDLTTDELVAWTTTSWYGRKAVGRLLDLYAREARKHPGLMPVVTLSAKDEVSPDYGLIPAPVLAVVDWRAFGDGAAPPGSRASAPSLDRVRPMLAIEHDASPANDPGFEEWVEKSAAEVAARDFNDDSEF